MKVLWSSNSPFCSTGYGMQTSVAAKRLKAMGHDVAIFAFYGLEGSKVDWGDIPIYPNNVRDYGIEHAPMFYDDWKADIYLTLVDVWVLRRLDPTMKWVPWMPVDHNPVPPLVVEALKKSLGLVKPIAMSKFGQEELAQNGIESYYIPHTVNTTLFSPNEEAYKTGRERYGWKDKFVIGTVATNHVERKNWNASMKAVAKFSDRHPGEVVYYMHTNLNDERGINLAALRENLKMQEYTRVPSIAQMNIGIEQEVMARIYNVMDVFLLPSKGEGFGIPLVEAQSCSVPIITTKCTAQEELMGGGYFIEKLTPEWTAQASWQFQCDPDEIVEKLELAYQAKKDGSIAILKEKARAKALEYDEDKVFTELWTPVLADIEQRIKQPRNMEGVQGWRLAFIPQSCVPRKVLDIGCGVTQPYRKHLEKLGEYTGVDIREGQGIVKADAHHLPFPNKSFGFVWCSEMLEHVEEPEKVVAEARRVGCHGVILFSTPLTPSFRIDPDHKTIDPRKVKYTTMASGDGMVAW